MMVRNEAQILLSHDLHDLAQGIDRFLVVDNGSTDGTDSGTRGLAGGGRSAGPATMGRIARRRSPPRWRVRRSTVEPIGLCRLTLTSSGYAARGNFRRVLV